MLMNMYRFYGLFSTRDYVYFKSILWITVFFAHQIYFSRIHSELMKNMFAYTIIVANTGSEFVLYQKLISP